MANSDKALVAFALPASVLGLAAAAAWLSGGLQAGPGPMRLSPPPGRRSPEPILFPEPDQPPATTFEKISPLQAELRNALIPYSHAPLLAPARYQAGAEPGPSALQCLTSAIYYEAGQEPLVGQRAVAQVVINRWASAPFPKTICGVVQQGAPRPGCQFTFQCDGSLSKHPAATAWAASRAVAEGALAGGVDADVGMATHYHADYVVPVWATTMVKLIKIGHHIFYRWAGAKPLSPLDLAAPPEPFGSPLPGLSAPISATSPVAVSATTLTEASPQSPPVAIILPPPESRVLSETAPAPAQQSSTPTLAEPLPPSQLEPRDAPPPRRAVPEDSLRSGPV